MAQNTAVSDAVEAAEPASVAGAEQPMLKEHEKWLYENPEALAMVKRGLADLAAGRVHERPSYAEYADIDIED